MEYSHSSLFRTAVTAVLLLAAAVSNADDSKYMIEVLPTKKVIHVDMTGLPGNTSLMDLLKTVPELLDRGKVDLYANFDVQYDGKSVGYGRDAVLLNTWLGEVDRVEISLSPTATQQKNGQSGVINIVPHALKEGFGGDVTLSGSSEMDVMPSVSLGYKTKKLELRGSFSYEYYKTISAARSSQYMPGYTVNGIDTTCLKYHQETAKLNLKYSISDRDNIKAWMWESWSIDEQDRLLYLDEHVVLDASPLYLFKKVDEKDRLFNSTAIAEYEHLFREKGKMVLTGTYQFAKENSETRNGDESFETAHLHPADVTGVLKFEIPVTTLEGRDATVETGVNTSFSSDVIVENISRTTSVSPYATFKYNGSHISVNANLNYSWYRRWCSFGSLPEYRKDDHHVLGNANVVWQIVPHHALRLMLSRTMMRPSDAMLYPELYWYLSKNRWQKGNPDLSPAFVYSADLSYITDWNNGRHYITTNVGLRYDYAYGLFEQLHMYEPDRRLFYYTYVNSGKNHIISANTTLSYAVGMFSMVLAGNVFYNNMAANVSNAKEYFYYNLALTPMFRLPRKWTVTLNVLHNSKARQGNTIMGDYFYAEARVSKSFNGWTLHACLSDIFHYQGESSTMVDGIKTTNYSDVYNRFLELGVSYRFGARR